MRKLTVLLFLWSAVATPLLSAATTLQIIRAGRLLDVNTGTYANDQAIVINGDRIESVGPFKPVAGAKVIDLSAYTVLPGLTDCHAHILGNLNDFSATGSLRMSSAEGTIWGAHNLKGWLDHGFTTIRDAGEADLGYGQLALRDGVARGFISGPRIFSAGNFVSVTGGHGDADPLAPDQALKRRPNIADTVDEVALAVRRDLKYGADWIKLMGTGGVLDPFSDYNRQELSEEQMAKAVEIAHRAGRKVMVHAEGTVGIKAAVRAGVDSIEHGTMLDEEGATLMQQHGTWLVPTLWTFQYGVVNADKTNMEPIMLEKSRTIIGAQAPAFRRALDHHLHIAFGLDMDPEQLPKEFEALVRGGMTPLQAIQAATINASELLGHSDDFGSIARGKFADVIAVSGDPLSDVKVLASVPFVMKAGVVVKDERGTASKQ
jgi:imidazolonepropionase-like amidohydrolase